MVYIIQSSLVCERSQVTEIRWSENRDYTAMLWARYGETYEPTLEGICTIGNGGFEAISDANWGSF